MEIERKFKINTLPDLDKYKCFEIEQAYLSRNPVVRVRRKNDAYILTYKRKFRSGQDGPIVNDEREMPLTPESFAHLVEKRDGIVIKKKRYIIPLEQDGLVAELDVFEGDLEGLFFAEVEFPDIATAENFEKPDWLGEDVTGDKRYSNGYLSAKGHF